MEGRAEGSARGGAPDSPAGNQVGHRAAVRAAGVAGPAGALGDGDEWRREDGHEYRWHEDGISGRFQF
jgi:hypothetical protein